MRHGDLTISNILIKEQSNSEPLVSLIDWGSFVFNKTINSIYNQCAPDFVSPELQNSPKYTCSNKCLENLISIKSDIYSLGLVVLYLLDPTYSFKKYMDKYIYDSKINDYQHYILENILNSIKIKYDYISEHVGDRVFFILSKMLENNINMRIDIDTLFMDELFTKYRIKEKIFNKFTLRNILKKNNTFKVDFFKNLFVNCTYDFLKKYKTRDFKPLLDTRIILLPSVKLFYNYLTTINIIDSNNINQIVDTNYKNNINKVTFKLSNINHYIISFLCCIKWIDIIINDDISVYYLYEYYIKLYKLFSKQFSESLILDITNFLTMFDLTFFLIFEKTKNIFTYPDLMDFKYECISHTDVKKIMLSSDVF
jgi:serine/threonine protein kinase